MATVKPFAALRYNIDSPWETLCCPPYDIIPESEQSGIEARNPHNIIRLERPLGDDPYKNAAGLLELWRREGVLKRDSEPGFYLYEISFTQDGHPLKLSGLMARVKLEPFSAKVVLPHEETLSKAKEDRFSLMSETFCNFSQIYCLYDGAGTAIPEICPKISETEKPLADFTMPDGTGHTLWSITDPAAAAEISRGFEGRQLFIADGHHRYETALRFRDHVRGSFTLSPEDYESAGEVLMMLVDISSPGLAVHPTHRLLRNLDSFDAGMVLASLTNIFDIRHTDDFDGIEKILAETPDTLAFCPGGGDCYILTLREKDAVRRTLPDMSAAYCGLSVTLLHTMILEPIFGIGKESMSAGKNLVYTRDKHEAIAAVDDGSAACAFLLPPTKVTEIRDVSLAGEKMPQKSTYFYPKLVCGMVINQIMDIPGEK